MVAAGRYCSIDELPLHEPDDRRRGQWKLGIVITAEEIGSVAVFASLSEGQAIGDFALPAARAKRCAGEFEQVRKAFNLRIMPYVDPELLIAIRARPWSLAMKP